MVLTPEILRLLEFDKLREVISSYSFSVLGKEAVSTITPISEYGKRDEQILLIKEFRALLNSTHIFPIPNNRDLRYIIQRASEDAYHLSEKELIAAGQITRDYKNVGDFLGGLGKEFPGLSSLSESTKKLPDLNKQVEFVFDENGDIRDSASAELKKIRKGFRKAHQRLMKAAAGLVSTKKKYLREENFTTREERIVLPVNSAAKGNVSGIVHGISQTQNTIFIEPLELVELNNECSTYRLREENEIKQILRSLSAIIFDNIDCYKKSIEEITKIDKIYAIATFSEEHDFSVPLFSNDNFLQIRQGRHPLLIVKKGVKDVVPFDIELGNESKILLISGPNMGGKTVFLKSIGIIILMAYSGLHIPAANESVIPTIDALYLDIGDEQSIEMDLSTFSSHIKNIVSAVKGATSNSLILLDEVGVGTDPEEGLGIAMAVLGKLEEKGALTFATTHYGKLKHFVADSKQMENASMDFDAEKGIPTYSLLIGIPGASHGFTIAERMGFPSELLDRAKSYIDRDELKTDKLICSLGKLMKKLKEEEDVVRKHEEELEMLLCEYHIKKTEIQEREKEFIKDAKERSLDIVYQTRKQMEHIIKDIRESQASREKIKFAKKVIEAKIEKCESEGKSGKKEKILPGDYVFSTKLKTSGTVIDILNGYARVDGENIRFLAPFDTLEIRTKEDAKHEEKSDLSNKDTVTELDIRGLRAEEAKTRIVRFIDDCVLSGTSTVFIIHGKGTGVLREIVDELLREDNRVTEHRLGSWNEGGSGITVVQLKA